MFLFLALFRSGAVIASDENLWAERENLFYSKAVPNAANFHDRLVREGEPWPELGVRSIMDHVYVLAFAAAFLDANPQASPPWKERLDLDHTVRLLKLLEEMQDKDEKSKTFGNLRWYWRTPQVTDHNAVEFISAHAIPLRMGAFESLPKESRELLERILKRCLEGCLSHTVRPDYTNIALGNAVHLVILGEMFDRPDAAEAGRERLRDIMFAIWDHGIFEYGSPTYYAIDSDSLELGYRYIKNEESAKMCEAMLELLWADLSLSWFGPAGLMAGAHSRSYDYLYARGDVSRLYEFAGLSSFQAVASQPSRLDSFHRKYRPENSVLESSGIFPREIKLRWGSVPGRFRTTYFLENITLGTASASYPNALQDIVMAVDIADDSDSWDSLNPRCYFIPDGRNDPYGIKKYSTSAAGHRKALHLEPFWTAAQRKADALGLVLYTERSLRNPNAEAVLSHFVFRNPDEIRIGRKKILIEETSRESVHEIIQGDPVVFRYGSRAIGLRIPWARTEKGNRAKIELVLGGNEYGVSQITVRQWENSVSLPLKPEGRLANVPGAAFQVRIGNSLGSETAFEKWCEEFSAARPKLVKIEGNDFSLEIPGIEGPVKLSGTKMFTKNELLLFTPEPPSGIFELDGKEIGRPILETAEPIKSYVKRIESEKPIKINPKGETEWEAESGILFRESLIEKRTDASGGKAVRINGPIHWTLTSESKGPYYLWARVLCIDAEHDSVYVDISMIANEKLISRYQPEQEWHLGNSKGWRWVPLKFDRPENPTAMELRPGTWRLRLNPREKDAIIDRFLLTTDPNKKFNPSRP